MVEKLTTGPLCGFCQAEAVHVVLGNLSAKAPGGRECPACAVHPLGEGGLSATHTEAIEPSCRGDSTVAATVTRTVPGWDWRLIRSSTHAFRSWGGQHLKWFSCAPQLGTSQGATATTLACGPSNGTRAARASKAVGHWCLGR